MSTTIDLGTVQTPPLAEADLELAQKWGVVKPEDDLASELVKFQIRAFCKKNRAAVAQEVQGGEVVTNELCPNCGRSITLEHSDEQLKSCGDIQSRRTHLHLLAVNARDSLSKVADDELQVIYDCIIQERADRLNKQPA